MAELADAPDLGSGGLCPWEFESPLAHHFGGKGLQEGNERHTVV